MIMRSFESLKLSCLLLLAGLAACSSSERVVMPKGTDELGLHHFQAAARIETPTWKKRPEGEIAPGFEIEVKSSQDSAINAVARVDANGKIQLPYDVEIEAAGVTLEELRDRARKAYSRYLVNPDVQVEIAKREYYLEARGLVEKPGQYLVRPGASLDEIIAQAGGLVADDDPNAAPQYAVISQLGVTNTVNLREYFAGNRAQIPEWQGGETIYFQVEPGPAGSPLNSRASIQFLGEVKRPGEYPFAPDNDFFDYLIRAGGPTDRANLDRVALLRDLEGQREVITFSSADPSSVPSLSPGDTLIFNPDTPSKLEKDTRIAGGFAGVLSAVASILILLAL